MKRLPITAIVSTRNEAPNLPACLRSLREFDQVIVVDSNSTDETPEIARRAGAEIHHFFITGGWPRKRQWAMSNMSIRNRWTLLLDADERVTPELRRELGTIVGADGPHTGYWIALRLVFLGRILRFGGSGLRKLSFFRTGRARFERLSDSDDARTDMEIHEHLILDGTEGHCRAYIQHENVQSIEHYIDKHNAYSTWSASVAMARRRGEQAPDARNGDACNQADRRRAMMNAVWRLPGLGAVLPAARFLYFYIGKLGFLDGVAGFYYCGFKGVQGFHIAAKVHEAERAIRLAGRRRTRGK